MPLDSKVDDLLELGEDDLKEMLSPSSLEEVCCATRAISPFTCEGYIPGYIPNLYAILVIPQPSACVPCIYVIFSNKHVGLLHMLQGSAQLLSMSVQIQKLCRTSKHVQQPNMLSIMRTLCCNPSACSIDNTA